MHRRNELSKAELASGLAIVALCAATVFQLLSVQSSFLGDDDSATATRAKIDAGLLVSDLRRAGSADLLSASPGEIELRVPAAVGVVCASDRHTTTLAALPARTGSLDNVAVDGVGWRQPTGEFAFAETGTRLRAATGGACARAGIAAPAGSLLVELTPGVSNAPVGSAVVVYERVGYRFRPSTVQPGHAALWRTDDEAAQLLATLAPDAAFQFYVDAAPAPTANVPAPLSRVRGIELHLPAARTTDQQYLAALPSAVFFQPAGE